MYCLAKDEVRVKKGGDPVRALCAACGPPAEQRADANHDAALPERERQRGAQQYGCQRR